MKKTTFFIWVLLIVILIAVRFIVPKTPLEPAATLVPTETEMPVPKDQATEELGIKATERYYAQVDRVKVVFEQWDYTRYRLQTNDLVREGELNTERGFENDPDATVYVLNWQKSEGEQIRYVRLTAEPTFLYALDGYQNIIRSGRLVLENN